jgi:hypothetical protein
VFVTTKLLPTHVSAARQLEQSLLRLGLDYVDLYLIHWPLPLVTARFWRELKSLQDRGLARAIGVSNFGRDRLETLMRGASRMPTVDQVQFSPFRYRRRLLDYCLEQGIVFEAYSPLERGQGLHDPTITAVAERLGRTPAQVVTEDYRNTSLIRTLRKRLSPVPHGRARCVGRARLRVRGAAVAAGGGDVSDARGRDASAEAATAPGESRPRPSATLDKVIPQLRWQDPTSGTRKETGSPVPSRSLGHRPNVLNASSPYREARRTDGGLIRRPALLNPGYAPQVVLPMVSVGLH